MTDSTVTQEQVLQLLDQQGTLPDTRQLYKGAAHEAQDGSWNEAAFKENAAWQLQLQSVLKSLNSRDVSGEPCLTRSSKARWLDRSCGIACR